MLYDIFGWAGVLLLIAGLWLVGNKIRRGFLCTLVGEALCLTQAISLGMWNMVFLCLVFIIIAFRNFIKWSN